MISLTDQIALNLRDALNAQTFSAPFDTEAGKWAFYHAPSWDRKDIGDTQYVVTTSLDSNLFFVEDDLDRCNTSPFQRTIYVVVLERIMEQDSWSKEYVEPDRLTDLKGFIEEVGEFIFTNPSSVGCRLREITFSPYVSLAALSQQRTFFSAIEVVYQ